LAASGVTAGSYGDGGATRTLAYGGTFKLIGALTVDAKGRVTAVTVLTMTLPSENRGITQLTGDVTAPATTNGSAAATLAASGVVAGAYGDGGAKRTLAYGGTFKIPATLTVDAKGRVTAAEVITLTLPSENRGITQLTGDVTAPSTANGSVAATIKSSVALAGAPTAPTAAVDVNTTQIASTAFVRNRIAKERGYVPKTDPGASADYGRLWVNSDGLLAVNDHLIEWGRNIDLSNLLRSVSGGSTLTMAVEVSGVYRYTVAGAKGGKGANSETAVSGGDGGAGYVNEGVVSLTATQVVRLTSGKAGAGGAIGANGDLAVFDGKLLSRTSNGSSWQTGDTLAAPLLVDMVYGNGVYVGISAAGHIAISDDGATWRSSALSSSYVWARIYCFNGRFFAVSSNFYIAESEDAQAWSSPEHFHSYSSTTAVMSAAYGNGVRIVGAQSGTSHYGYFSRSVVGGSWQMINLSLSDYYPSTVTFYKGYFYLFIREHNNAKRYITARRMAADMSASTSWFDSVRIATMPSLYLASVSAVVGKDLLVGIDSFGLSFATNDGVAWATGALPVTNVDLWNRVAYWNGKFYAVGTAGKIASSLDGLSWTMESSPLTTDLIAVVCDSVVAGGGGAGGLSKLENLSTGTTIISSNGGAGGGGAYNNPNDGKPGGDAASNVLGGAGGTSGHPAGYPGQGGTNTQTEGYCQLVFQKPL
jgi:hypothetical protein